MALPKKLFNRCKAIPFAKIIFTSRNGGAYRFCGVRDKRLGYKSVMYSIPNIAFPKHPYIKAFQSNEVDLLWKYLIDNKKITTIDFKRKCKDLYKEGACCFSAFFGIVDSLYPNLFFKKKGVIKFK